MTTLTQKMTGNPKLGKLLLLLTVACLLLLTVYLWQNRADPKARQALDSILADEPQIEWQVPDWFSYHSPVHPFANDPDRLFQNILDEMQRDFEMPFHFPVVNPLPLQSPSIQIQETPDVYIVKVPLNQPSDADKVQIQVNPNHIQVSGQVASRNDDHFYSASSFMQSFSTTSQLDASRIQKKVDGKMLVVTIPKKHESVGAKPFPIMPSGSFI